MDQHKKQNNPIFCQINSSNKALQLLLSLSALAIIASQYSSLLSYLSSIKILSFSTSDRHYIFLICNGIMLLVIKTSGFFASPETPDTEFHRDSHVIRHNAPLSHHQSNMIRENMHLNNNVAYNQFAESNNMNNIRQQIDDLPEANADTNTEAEEATEGITGIDQGAECVTSTAERDEKELSNDFLDHVDEQQEHEEHEEEEEQEIMLWSTEELNKKCDDFIRKMKYGIKYEAPLVMV